MPLGVKALNTFPLKSAKRDKGLRDVPVSFAGVTVHPGDWVYADKVGGCAPCRLRWLRSLCAAGCKCKAGAAPERMGCKLHQISAAPAALRCAVQDGIIVSPEELTL